jgi:hypothetical protein
MPIITVRHHPCGEAAVWLDWGWSTLVLDITVSPRRTPLIVTLGVANALR